MSIENLDLPQEIATRDVVVRDLVAQLRQQAAAAQRAAKDLAAREAKVREMEARLQDETAELRQALAQQVEVQQRLVVDREAAQREAAALRQALAEQTVVRETEGHRQELLDLLLRRLERVAEDLQQTCRNEIQEQIDQSREELAERDARILAALESLKHLSTAGQAAAGPSSPSAMKGTGQQQYREMMERVRRVVASAVPANATIAVASKGDPELLQLEGRQGWHFPQREDGIYSGFYPKDSAAAVEQVDRIRAKGAEFLLFPATAFWWLDYYTDFAVHLRGRYRVVARDEQTCLIFALQEKSVPEPAPPPGEWPGYRHLVRQVCALVDSILPPGAKVVVVSKGDPDLLELGRRMALHFPQDAKGGYAGHYPKDSADAIAHLEELRRRGAEFLVVPKTAAWWFHHYQEFGRYLEANCRTVLRQRHVCTIFDLNRR